MILQISEVELPSQLREEDLRTRVGGLRGEERFCEWGIYGDEKTRGKKFGDYSCVCGYQACWAHGDHVPTCLHAAPTAHLFLPILK